MRADAQRNRDRLVEVAREVFKERGLDAPLDEIARRAGVGAGTLYRHFPTRETLLVAAHHRQLALVCETATALAARHTAAEATRLWLEHFLDYAMASSDMCTALNAAITSEADPFAHAHALLSGAVTTLLDAGARDGSLRSDIAPGDALLLVGGIATAAQRATREQVHRLIGLLVDALSAPRPCPYPAPPSQVEPGRRATD